MVWQKKSDKKFQNVCLFLDPRQGMWESDHWLGVKWFLLGYYSFLHHLQQASYNLA